LTRGHWGARKSWCPILVQMHRISAKRTKKVLNSPQKTGAAWF